MSRRIAACLCCAIPGQGWGTSPIPGKPLARADVQEERGGFPSPAVWGVMAVWDAAGDPRGGPAQRLARRRCGLWGISSPCAAQAVDPFPVCKGRGEGRQMAAGGW